VISRLDRHLTLARHRRQGRQIIHLLHIGKTGGSAVKVALDNHLVTDRFVITLNPHHTTLRDVRRGDSVVFFLRDPIARFVSGFYSRQRRGQPRSYSEWTPDEREAFEHFGKPNDLAAALSSTDAELKQCAQKAMRSIRHVRDSYWKWFDNEAYFRSRAADIFFVGHQETLNADFEVLRQKLELPVEAALPSDPVRAHKNPDHLDYGLDDVAVENLRDWYQADWRFIELCRKVIENQSYEDTKACA
jgi:hypothetical protein